MVLYFSALLIALTFSHCRTSHDANKDKITKLSTELEDWVEDYLGFLLVSGYGEKVVQREISQVFWLCPFYSVDSIEFKILCCFAIVGAILNDWVASSNTQNANCRMDVVEYLTNLLDTGKAGSPGWQIINIFFIGISNNCHVFFFRFEYNCEHF